jgi:hypothetical protein
MLIATLVLSSASAAQFGKRRRIRPVPSHGQRVEEETWENQRFMFRSVCLPYFTCFYCLVHRSLISCRRAGLPAAGSRPSYQPTAPPGATARAMARGRARASSCPTSSSGLGRSPPGSSTWGEQSVLAACCCHLLPRSSARNVCFILTSIVCFVCYFSEISGRKVDKDGWEYGIDFPRDFHQHNQ